MYIISYQSPTKTSILVQCRLSQQSNLQKNQITDSRPDKGPFYKSENHVNYDGDGVSNLNMNRGLGLT